MKIDDVVVQNDHVQNDEIEKITFEFDHEIDARVVTFQIQFQTQNVVFAKKPRRFFYVLFRVILTKCYAKCDDDVNIENRKTHDNN